MRISTILAAVAAEVCQDSQEDEVVLLQLRGFQPRAQEEKVLEPAGVTLSCANSTIFDEESWACLTLAQYSQKHRSIGDRRCSEITTAADGPCKAVVGCFHKVSFDTLDLPKDQRCFSCSVLPTMGHCAQANRLAAILGSSCVWNDGACVAGATVVLGKVPAQQRSKDVTTLSAGITYRPFAVKTLYRSEEWEWLECTDEARCPRDLNFEVVAYEGRSATSGFWRTGSGTDVCARHFDYQWPQLKASGDWATPALRQVVTAGTDERSSRLPYQVPWPGYLDDVVSACIGIQECKAISCAKVGHDCTLLDALFPLADQLEAPVLEINPEAKPWGACGVDFNTPPAFTGVGFDLSLRCPQGAEFLQPQALIILNQANDFVFNRGDWTVVWDGEVLPVADERRAGVPSMCWVSWDGKRDTERSPSNGSNANAVNAVPPAAALATTDKTMPRGIRSRPANARASRAATTTTQTTSPMSARTANARASRTATTTTQTTTTTSAGTTQGDIRYWKWTFTTTTLAPTTSSAATTSTTAATSTVPALVPNPYKTATCTRESTDPSCFWRAVEALPQIATISCQLRVPTNVPQQHNMKLLYTGVKEQVVRFTNTLPWSFLKCEDRKFCLRILNDFPFHLAEHFRSDNRPQARCVLHGSGALGELKEMCWRYRTCLEASGHLEALQATARAAGGGGGTGAEEDSTHATPTVCGNPSTADLQGLTCNCLPTWTRRCNNIAEACDNKSFRKAHKPQCAEVRKAGWKNGRCIRAMFCFDDSVCDEWKVASGCMKSNNQLARAGELTVAYDEGVELSLEQVNKTEGAEDEGSADSDSEGEESDEDTSGAAEEDDRADAELRQDQGASDVSSGSGGDLGLAEQYPGGSAYKYKYQPPPQITYTVKNAPAFKSPEVGWSGYTSFSRRRCMFSPLATGQ